MYLLRSNFSFKIQSLKSEKGCYYCSKNCNFAKIGGVFHSSIHKKGQRSLMDEWLEQASQ